MRFHPIIVLLALVFVAGCGTMSRQSGTADIRWPGIAQRRETDFDRRTWNGTSVRLVGQLLEGIPDRIDSAAEHRLARNILVTVADAPPDARDSSAFIALRTAKLMAMGNFADAAAMGRQAPDLPRDVEEAARQAEAELLAGETEMACIDYRALGQRSSQGQIEQAVALCKARAGEPDAALPGSEAGVLVRIAGQPLPATLPDASIAELAAIGLDPKLSSARRLEPAFEAGRASAVDGAVLAKILQSVPARGRAQAGPPTSGAEAAVLFHAIEQADPARKLALAEGGILSRAGGVDQVSIALTVPLRAVKPRPGLAPLSARFARLLYAAGDADAARPWAELAARSGQAGAVWPYRAVLGQAKPAEFEKWRKQPRTDRTERALAVVSAFDGAPVIAAADRSSSTEVAAMDEAANSQRVGETVLRALALLGSDGPARTDPDTLGRVLMDLDRVNLHDEARALAFEALAGATSGGQVDKPGTNAHS
jgi:hypothetical protein